MEKRVKIPVSFEGSEGKETCFALLHDALARTRGVFSAEVDGQASLLTLRYDPGMVSLRRVQQVAHGLGVDLRKHFEHCTFSLEGMNCSDCALALERSMGRLEGVPSVSVDLAGRRLRVEYDSEGITLEEIRRRIKDLGYQPRPVRAEEGLAQKERPLPGVRGMGLLLRGPLGRMASLTALCAVLGAGGAALSWLSQPAPWVPVLLYALAYVAGAFYAARSAFSALRSLTVDVNLLMVVAALGAASIGHWGEGAVLMFLFSLSNTLEALALGSTRRAIRSLMGLRPAEALLLQIGRASCRERVYVLV